MNKLNNLLPSLRLSPLLLPVLAFGPSAAFPGAAAADALISMNGSVNSTGTPAADATPSTKSSHVADGFTINAGSSHTFSAAIAYGIAIGGPAAIGSTTYSTGSLWNGTTGGPATLVENLTTSSVSGTTYGFTPTAAITLTGGDTYWLAVSTTKQQTSWYTSTAESSGPDATYVGDGQGKLTGNASSPSISTYGAGPGGMAGIEIDGTLVSVPEPGSLALLGSAGGAGQARALPQPVKTENSPARILQFQSLTLTP